MGLRNLTSLKQNPTITVTNGTSLTFAEDGVSIANGIHMVCVTDSDFAARRQLTAKVRPATLDPKTGSYTKAKKDLSIGLPLVLGSGSVIFNAIRIGFEDHPMLDTASAKGLRFLAAQLLTDPAMDSYWEMGTFN